MRRGNSADSERSTDVREAGATFDVAGGVIAEPGGTGRIDGDVLALLLPMSAMATRSMQPRKLSGQGLLSTSVHGTSVPQGLP